MKSICVFLGSSEGSHATFSDTVDTVSSLLCSRKIRVVYGGIAVGLMGRLSRNVRSGGGEVRGITTRQFLSAGIADTSLSDLQIEETLTLRFDRMIGDVDGVLVLPGGIGTCDELFQLLTRAILGEFTKPIALMNVNGYYDHLLRFLDHAVVSGFIREPGRNYLIVETDVARAIDRMTAFRHDPGTKKWIASSTGTQLVEHQSRRSPASE